jgi:hypothetical protein
MLCECKNPLENFKFSSHDNENNKKLNIRFLPLSSPKMYSHKQEEEDKNKNLMKI